MSQNPYELMQQMPQQPFGEIPEDEMSLDEIAKSHDLPDGSSVYNIGLPMEQEEQEAPKDFHANLAKDMDEKTLSGLASRLLDEIKQDKDSRQEWESTINLALKYLGFKVEEFRTIPFAQACAVFDSTLAVALLSYYSTARAELFPAAGPAKAEIVGSPSQATEDQADRVKTFMNNYLTQVDRDYYPDSERLLMYNGLFGCAFRKVYQDPILNRPVARTIAPQDFIVNHHTTSLMSSSRMTQVLYLSRKEVMQRIKSQDFIRFTLPATDETQDDDLTKIGRQIKRIEGVNTEGTENKSLFKFYEVHVDLDDEDLKAIVALDEDDKGVDSQFSEFFEESEEHEIEVDEEDEDLIPRPYVVTICEQNKKVVAIRRNWEEGDETFARCEYFVDYRYLPGFGIYGLGLAHLMGSSAIAMTSITRQCIDAELLAMFPGGLKQRGMRLENNNKVAGLSEFIDVETGGQPLSECVMFFPYKGASQVALALLDNLSKKTEAISAVNNAQIPENGVNTPVGTTLAMIEVANKSISSILRSGHVSLGYELKLLFNLFGKYMPDAPYPFAVPGSDTAVMRRDFSDTINIVPVSDPNVLTSTHRILRAEALLKLANSAPQIHNQREAFKRMYQAMNVENIDQLLPEPQAPQPPARMDPITENTFAMQSKPIMAYMDQDHASHMIVHQAAVAADAASQTPNQAFQAAIAAHLQEHKSFAYVIDMEMTMHAQMPPEQMLQDPQIQNQIALHAAQALQHKQQEEQANQPRPLDPNEIMLADIDQHREAAHLKHDEALMKTETEAYKAQLRFESEKEQRKTDLEIADEKNAVDMAINQIKRT